MASPYVITIKIDTSDTKALSQLIKDLERVGGAAPKAKQATDQLNKGLRQTQIQARTSGRAVQNASYQIQDMIVQISGGVDPLRSFSQQLPQLFINAGKVGAALGLVAAALPLVIQYFRDAADQLAPFDEELKGLNETLAEVTKLTSELDFKKWNEQWNGATESVKGAMLALLRFQERVASEQLTDALAALQGETIELSNWDQLLIKAKALGSYVIGLEQDVNAAVEASQIGTGDVIDKLADDMSLAQAEAKELYRILNSGLTGESLFTRVVEFAQSVSSTDPDFQQLIANTKALADAQQSLIDLQNQIKAVEGGGPLPTGDEANAAAEAAREYAKQLEEIARAYQALYPSQVKFFEAIKLSNTMLEAGLITADEYEARTNALAAAIDDVETGKLQKVFEDSIKAGQDFSNNDVAEQFSLAKESLDIFTDGWDTMTDAMIRGTTDMEDAVKNMVKVLIMELAKLFATQGIAALLSGSGSSFLQSIGTAMTASAKGNVFSGGNVVPFAKGGVVSQPTIFPMANGAGLMGEAGPEAVMPLARNSRGELGVKGGGMNVVINNMASGVRVEPRQTDNGLTIDVVMDAVANDVRRGGNRLSDAFESTYSVNRGRGIY
jgi:hypothetical protein